MVIVHVPMPKAFKISKFSSWPQRQIIAAAAITAFVSCIVTYGLLVGWIGIGPDVGTVGVLLVVNCLLLSLVALAVGLRILTLWRARRSGLAGSRLYLRLSLFSALLAIVPTVVVSVFSILFFNIALQAWFSSTVRTALDESHHVAQAYWREHENALRNESLSLVRDLARQGALVYQDKERLAHFIDSYALIKRIPEIVIFERNGQVLAKNGANFVLSAEAPPPPSAFAKADSGEVALITAHGQNSNRVRALARVDRAIDTYVYMGRFVDSRVLNHIERVAVAVRSYQDLEGQHDVIKIGFAAVFITIALLLLLLSIWAGLQLAHSLVSPLVQVIEAAGHMRSGRLNIQVDEKSGDDEIDVLGRAFNRMASRLREQRRRLVASNRQLNLRQKFTQTVLTGISAGVIGLDERQRINLPNRPASQMLGRRLESMIGEDMASTVPEMMPLLERAQTGQNDSVEGNLTIQIPSQSDGGEIVENQVRRKVKAESLLKKIEERQLVVRISVQRTSDKIIGYVVTLDDITELVQAQRNTAWAEVARRIAHEIKNPLTPIQLAAERLQRKYGDQVGLDRATFTACTQTIIRQVRDIGRMVDEFSDFSRLPRSKIAAVNMVRLCQEITLLQKIAHSDIDFILRHQDKERSVMCDGRLIGQALTNILKNAAQALASKKEKNKTVTLEITWMQTYCQIKVEDNGPGFIGNVEQLTEPYVTTRSNGTGLGLAIVHKIINDHGGTLHMENIKAGGMRVVMRLPLRSQNDSARHDKLLPPSSAASTL